MSSALVPELKKGPSATHVTASDRGLLSDDMVETVTATGALKPLHPSVWVFDTETGKWTVQLVPLPAVSDENFEVIHLDSECISEVRNVFRSLIRYCRSS